jgi:endonuclease/exonuclease/phosphatase (EEP) superfamily protein YafD
LIKEHRPLLLRVGYSYVTLIGVWLLLRAALGDRFWLLALINTAAEYLFVPLPFLLVAAAWKRNWSLLLGLTLPLVTFAILFGELFLPAAIQTSREGEQRLVFMSFNVLHLNKDYDAIVGAIRDMSPDIVGLQELSGQSTKALATALATEYPYHTLATFDPVRSVGLLSRFPIESVTTFSLPPLDLSLHAIVRIDEQQVHAFVVHLSANNFAEYPVSELPYWVAERYARRAAEVVRLEQEIRPLGEPVVMLCDCNMTSTSETYTHLATFLNDSFREVGWGFGHTLYSGPVLALSIRIDYVWHSNDFVAIRSAPGRLGGSDHVPIVAELVLRPQPSGESNP